MKTKIVIDVSSPSFIGIVLVLELWVKMLSVNQIAGFFKIKYLKKQANYEVYFWHADKH